MDLAEVDREAEARYVPQRGGMAPFWVVLLAFGLGVLLAVAAAVYHLLFGSCGTAAALIQVTLVITAGLLGILLRGMYLDRS